MVVVLMVIVLLTVLMFDMVLVMVMVNSLFKCSKVFESVFIVSVSVLDMGVHELINSRFSDQLFFLC